MSLKSPLDNNRKWASSEVAADPVGADQLQGADRGVRSFPYAIG